MSEERIPAEVFAPGEFIEEELAARGWSEMDLAQRMPGDLTHNCCMVQLLIAVRDTGLIVTDDVSRRLGVAFDVSPSFFANLDARWRRYGPPSRHATAH